jgi:hypothetical protein
MIIPAVKKTSSTHKVEFVDGIKIIVEGANNATIRKPLYIKAKEAQNVPPVVIPPIVVNEPQPQFTIVGSGSGALILKDIFNKNIKIKEGNYDYIDITNFKNTNVIGAGVNLLNGSGITAMNNVTIEGLSVKGSKYRAFNINGIIKGFTLKNISLTDIGDVAINLSDATRYNGSEDSFSENLQLLNFDCDNIGMFLGARGSIANGFVEGLVKKFKMNGCSIINSPQMGNGVYMGCVEDYEISNNKLGNINSLVNNHHGIFHMVGNGKVFGNMLTNHQGNMLRAWFCSLTKEGYLEVFDNIVHNSRRYGAFEIQTPPWMELAAAFKPGKTAKIYNNTVGKLNTEDPKYFEGRLLDLYTSHCQVEVFNNLSFNNRDAEILNNMSDRSNTLLTRFENNAYVKDAAQAVNNLSEFKSLIPLVGARV